MITADGRDLSGEEWRPIPGLSRYEITRDGDVRNRRSGRLLKEVENVRTGAFAYHLWRDGGGKTSRSYRTLIRDAWEVAA